MTKVTLWHNPRCSKSRAALALLEDAGHEVTVRRYLEDKPSAQEVTAACKAIGGDLLSMMRRGEKAFKDAGLSKDSSNTDLLAAMVAYPILIERPIAFAGGKAVIGRPPERVLGIV